MFHSMFHLISVTKSKIDAWINFKKSCLEILIIKNTLGYTHYFFKKGRSSLILKSLYILLVILEARSSPALLK